MAGETMARSPCIMDIVFIHTASNCKCNITRTGNTYHLRKVAFDLIDPKCTKRAKNITNLYPVVSRK